VAASLCSLLIEMDCSSVSWFLIGCSFEEPGSLDTKVDKRWRTRSAVVFRLCCCCGVGRHRSL